MCCETLLVFLSFFLSMMIQKQIEASNKTQLKAPTPNMRAVITVVIELIGLNSSPIDSKVSVWKRGRITAEDT